eukprot:CAMPEP_0173168406 /NCGR_PEP_ID=MMETSP1141-20130122/129_1 /TAXON_ID=483371 /ORGANISM="non described non described, Strain CCMP2298" /LENGTH=47 /DNA_ID= /DNA_START= /DNA_END= /DNA_ORIENTATION=
MADVNAFDLDRIFVLAHQKAVEKPCLLCRGKFDRQIILLDGQAGLLS